MKNYILKVDFQNLTESEGSNLVELNTIYARNNELTYLNINGTDSLHRLYVRNNHLLEIDLSQHDKINQL